MKRRTNCVKTKLFYLSLLAGVILFSCRTDVYEIKTSEENHFGIDDARNWFETAIRLVEPNEASVRSADGGEKMMTLNPLLNWNLAELSSNEEWEVVELPWKYEAATEIFALWEMWQHACATGTAPENVARLVVMRHRETDETHGFRMKVAPALDYWLSCGDKLQDNKLLDRDSRLSGVVLFYTLDGLFVNGWRYRDGEIAAELISVTPVDFEDVNVSQTRLNRTGSNTDGFIFDDFVLVARANGGGSGGSGGTTLPFLFFDFDTPGTDWQHLHSVIPSYNDFLSSSGSGMPNVNQQQTQSIRQRVQRIFQTTRMLIEDLEALGKMLEEMLKDCLGQALYNALVSSGNKFTFEFWNSNYSTVHPVNRKVSLARDGFSTFYLFHELVHGYQLRMYDWYNPDRTGLLSGEQWNRNFINIEIEAHLLYYHYISSSTDEMSKHLKRMYESDDMYMEIAELASHFGDDGTIKNAAEFERYLINVVVPEFIKGHTNDRRPNPQFNDKMSYGTMFATMRDLWTASADCRSKSPKK